MKKIIVFVLIVVLVGLGLKYGRPANTGSATNPSSDIIPLSEVKRSELTISVPEIKLPEPKLALAGLGGSTNIDRAWNTFERYISAAKSHDLESLRHYSHQISETCNDSSQEKECFARMDNVVAIGERFKKEDFTHVWADDKQIILSTDYTLQEDTNGSPIAGLVRSVIYFTIDSAGNPKVLSFNDFDGAFILVDKNENTEEKLQKLIVDSDEDGLADALETCDAEASTCEGTSPSKRDTDGDGWWDGVEVFFYKTN